MLKSRMCSMVGWALVSTVAACGASAPEILYECQVYADGNCSCQGSPNQLGREQPPTATCSAGSETDRVCCGWAAWPGANADGAVGSCSCSKGTKCDPSGPQPKRVESCYEGDPVDDEPATASPSTCSDTGFCGPKTDKCSCGTACLHTSVGGYLCGFGCSTDADCRGKKDPQSGESFSTCGKGTFDNFCR